MSESGECVKCGTVVAGKYDDCPNCNPSAPAEPYVMPDEMRKRSERGELTPEEIEFVLSQPTGLSIQFDVMDGFRLFNITPPEVCPKCEPDKPLDNIEETVKSLPTKDELKRHMREQASADDARDAYARERARGYLDGETIDLSEECKAAWDACAEFMRGKR